MNHWLIIAGMTTVTFGVRYPVLAIFSRVELPPVLIRMLRYVPVAVLTAIVVPELFMPDGTIDISTGNSYLIAGLISVGIAWYTKRLLPTILIGMGVFLLLYLAL